MSGVDPALARAWLAGRSLARGLPAPVADHGGWRVETGDPAELRRYLFADVEPGLAALGAAIATPRVAVKLCGEADALAASLPARWHVDRAAGSSMMICDRPPADRPALPPGYRLDIDRAGAVSAARIYHDDAVVAGGYAAETDGVFVYDRIVVTEAHRRRGLGRALMAALTRCRVDPAARPVLTATPAGRRLYRTLGWTELSPYTTATIPD